MKRADKRGGIRGVVVLRRVLPMVAALIALAVVVQAGWRGYVARQGAPTAAQALLRMDNPRFAGADRDGGAFLITADAAVRDSQREDRVTLDKPVIVRGAGGPNPVRMTSNQGVYEEDRGLLSLTGDVRVDTGEGYRFASQQARIDTRTGAIVGDAALSAQGPAGQIRSDSYTVDDKGDRVTFKGRVRSTLQPR